MEQPHYPLFYLFQFGIFLLREEPLYIGASCIQLKQPRVQRAPAYHIRIVEHRIVYRRYPAGKRRMHLAYRFDRLH